MGWFFNPPVSPGFSEAQDPRSCLDFQDKIPPSRLDFWGKILGLKYAQWSLEDVLFLISKLWLNYIKNSIENSETKGAKLPKRERVFTFLGHKNQLPSEFFLCTKYGPKVNIIVENMTEEFNRHSFSRHKGLTWNYKTVACWVWIWVEMCQASQTLCCNNVVTARSLVSCSHFLP